MGAEPAFGVGAMIGPRAPAEPPSALLPQALAAWAGAGGEPAPGALFVLKLDPGGPAALSGQVREGDELVAADRQRVAELAPEAVAALLHGPLGSLVKLRVRRKTATFDVCLERAATRAVCARVPARPRARAPCTARQAARAPVASADAGLPLACVPGALCWHQPPPARKTRTLNPQAAPPGGGTEVLAKLYNSFAKVNAVREVERRERMSPEETKAFHAAREAEAKRCEAVAKRCIDAAKRRSAEIGVLRRELRELEKQDAPFSQVLEYRNWIRRLQMEEELGPSRSADLDLLELEAEELELQERAEYLRMTLRVLEQAASAEAAHAPAPAAEGGQDPARARERGPADGDAEGAMLVMIDGLQSVRPRVRGDVDVIKAKLRAVQEQLEHLRGDGEEVPAHGAGRSSSRDGAGDGARPGGAGGAGSGGGGSSSSSLQEHGGGARAGDCAATSVTAGLAAELGSKWGARSAEPREGARIAEGTLEDAPEPCMLAQGTIETAQRLWKFGL